MLLKTDMNKNTFFFYLCMLYVMEVFDMALKTIHSHHSEVIYFLLFLVNEAFDMALSAIIIAAIVAMGILLRYLLATSF